MKTIFIVNFHSYVDLITNSSTEIFVGKSRCVEEVKLILQPIYETLRKAGKVELPFDDAFDIRLASKEDQSNYMSWKKYYDFNIQIGDLIIEGLSDNSIPFHMFEIIEALFEASRFHLG